jgi:hypothetical protein
MKSVPLRLTTSASGCTGSGPNFHRPRGIARQLEFSTTRKRGQCLIATLEHASWTKLIREAGIKLD